MTYITRDTSWDLTAKWHDDLIKWKHFPRYWPFVRGIHRSPVTSPHKGQWHGALMFSLTCALNKQLNKQSLGCLFETPSSSLWRHCNGIIRYWSCSLNLLWLVDTIWRHRYGSTSAQVLPEPMLTHIYVTIGCLAVPRQYLKQCWFINKGVLWYSPENSFSRGANGLNVFRNYTYRIVTASPRRQWIYVCQLRLW